MRLIFWVTVAAVVAATVWIGIHGLTVRAECAARGGVWLEQERVCVRLEEV